jgi:hypothetical protein
LLESLIDPEQTSNSGSPKSSTLQVSLCPRNRPSGGRVSSGIVSLSSTAAYPFGMCIRIERLTEFPGSIISSSESITIISAVGVFLFRFFSANYF